MRTFCNICYCLCILFILSHTIHGYKHSSHHGYGNQLTEKARPVRQALISLSNRNTQFPRFLNNPSKSNYLIYGYSQLFMALKDPPLELCEENVLTVIDEIKQELGTIFGYNKGSRDVGITGELEYADIDGPTIFISLKGRFWHATDTVMMRVESYLRQRIPEIIEVKLDRSKSQIIDDNRLNSENTNKNDRKLF